MVIMKNNVTSDAPPEAVEAFEKWKELSLRLDKEAEGIDYQFLLNNIVKALAEWWVLF